MNSEFSSLPQHIAVIMDGNGRWAKKSGLSRTKGHEAGVEALRLLVENSLELGIRYLTVFAFSSENWARPTSEVTALMTLLRNYLKKEKKKALSSDNNISYRFIGDLSKLDEDIRLQIQEIENVSKDKNGLCLSIALSYGGRDEIAFASRNIAFAVKQGKIEPSDIDENLLASYLYAPDIPYPDLLIRTSGEERISNFMLWQLAYTEMVFTDTLWPDFSLDDLQDAIAEFGKRTRRYGKV